MEKEILELLKTLAGSTETLIIWYMVMHTFNNVVGWIGGVCCMYWLGRGARGLAISLTEL